MKKENIAPEIEEILYQLEREKPTADGSRTTMSVREMAKLLGIGKTDSYWLIHKHFFKTVQVGGRMRVDIESFQDWYDNQVKYHIIGGRAPGRNLRKQSYSAADIGKILGISEARAYELILEHDLPVVTVDYWKRVPKEAFEEWYTSQSHYRNQEDRERDAALENATISMPEMARILGVPRSTVYSILKAQKYQGQFEIVVVAGRRRITKKSFEEWYEGQYHYQKEEHPEIQVDRFHNIDPDCYSVAEAADVYDIPRKRIYQWIRRGILRPKKAGNMMLLGKAEFDLWMKIQGKEAEEWQQS